MHIKLQSFQAPLRKGFSRVEKEAKTWFEEHQYITLQETKLSVLGDTIVYVILYTEEENYSYQGSSAHYEQATRESLHTPDAVQESSPHYEQEQQDEEKKPFKLGEQAQFRKGLSINHLFKD